LNRSEPKTSNILARMHHMCLQPWFHGDLDLNEALRRLSASNAAGTFLVRFSTNIPGAFTITRVVDSDGQVAHARVNRTHSGGFSVNQDAEFKTLDELLKYLSDEDVLGLKTPCPGSKFQIIFATKEQPFDAYQPVPIKN